MGAFRKDDGLYSKAEAFICLNCNQKKCFGNCKKLKDEKRRLKNENTETCVACGEIIPEGRQVCPYCEIK